MKIIDELIEKIPPHIRDIIQKAALAVFALVALVAVSISVMRGLNDAQPGGMQVADGTQDLFYLELLREQNKAKAKLLEDVPMEPSEFPSYNENESDPFATFGADRSQNLMGEGDAFLNNQETLRKTQDDFGEPLLQESTLPLQEDAQPSQEQTEIIPPFSSEMSLDSVTASAENKKNTVETNEINKTKSKENIDSKKEELPFLE